MFWPRMSPDLKEYITKCDVCLAYQNAPHKETIIQHEVTAWPWVKVGADLCDAQGRTLLVGCDYFSGFIEVERLQSTTSSAVSKAIRVLFARYGIPNVLVTDNGPQFAATEFATFTNKWRFQHVTSSPRYPQSNGRRWRLSNGCSRSVVRPASQSSWHFWTGRTHLQRVWAQVQLWGSLEGGTKLSCQWQKPHMWHKSWCQGILLQSAGSRFAPTSNWRGC